MPTHLNEQQAEKTIPLLSLSVQVSQREGKKHHLILAHLNVLKDTQTDVNITSTGYSCEKEKGKWIELRAKLVCSPYLFSWIISFSVIRGNMLCQYIQTRVVYQSWYEERKIHPCGGQLLFSWGESNASWIEGAISIFTYVFERKTSIKNAPPPLFHFLSSSLLEYSRHSLARRNVWVSISNKALVSIKSPGVSPKIHTFCQSLGRDGGWNRAEARVRKRCLRLQVTQSLGVQWQAGFLLRSTLAFPGAEITTDCLNLQKRRCGPEATACEMTIQLNSPPTPVILVYDIMRLIVVLVLLC